jgi:hypothetical protein
MRFLPACILVFLISVATHADDDGSFRLFTISRSINKNVVCYDAQLNSDRKLKLKDPLDVYWLMHAEQGQREELTWFENTQAYGYTLQKPTREDSVIITIEAFEQKPIEIFNFNGVTEALMEISEKPALIQEIYVQSSGGFIPKVEYIELKGIERATGKPVVERIIP